MKDPAERAPRVPASGWMPTWLPAGLVGRDQVLAVAPNARLPGSDRRTAPPGAGGDVLHRVGWTQKEAGVI